ncbi:MAG: gamma-glutamylcyclotransferase [Gammaproteobacteria bacterium]|nr:gamma-glutamylcyclotransferase [Gammaproteobacteria bacterium]
MPDSARHRRAPQRVAHTSPRHHGAPAHRPWAAARPTHDAQGEMLFAYGTLVLPEIQDALLGYRLAGTPARLAGYRRFRVRDAVYPGIVPHPGGTLDGVLYRGVDAAAWAELDAFESDDYQRSFVHVDCAGSLVATQVYVVAPHCLHTVTDEPWEIAAFAREHLAAYLTRLD